MEIEAQREVSVQIQADQAGDSGLHLDGIILRNMGAHSWWAIRSSTYVGWSQRPGMTKRVFLKVATGYKKEKNGGWFEAERRKFFGFVLLKRC